MADLVLGATPANVTVNLVAGADFISGLDSQDGNWPGTAVIALKFDDPAHTVWTAALNGAAADWNVDKAAVAALAATIKNRAKVELIYTDGTTDLVWFRGAVMLRGF